MNTAGKLRTWRAWIGHRFGLQLIHDNVLDRRLPLTSWYQGDGATLLILLIVQVITGMFMTTSYAPTPERAYQSVQFITHELVLGWFLRGLHYWCAGLMVAMVFFHLFRQILVGGYKFPREGIWLIGIGLLSCVIVMAFVGYVLRWDERAIYALRVAMTMFWRVPWIGEHLVVFVQGGEVIGPYTLPRLYSVHVVFVPLLLLGLAAWHVYLVIVRGVTSKAERRELVRTVAEHERVYREAAESDHDGEQFHPTTTAKTGSMALLVVLVGLGLTLLFGPRELEPEANLVSPAQPAEEWYFWWYSGLIALLPAWLAPVFVVGFPITVLTLLIALPFIDRGPKRGVGSRPIAVATVVVLVGMMLLLSDLRRRSSWTGWPESEPPPIPARISLSADAESGRQLFARHGCTSCHGVGGHGRQVGPDLARISPPRSLRELRRYISKPPAGVPMPSYADSLTDHELDQIAAFVLVAQTFEREPPQAEQ